MFFISTIKKIFEIINLHFLTLQDIAKYKKNKNFCLSLNEESISNLVAWIYQNSINNCHNHENILIITSYGFETSMLKNFNNTITIIFIEKITDIKNILDILGRYNIFDVKILFSQLSRMLTCEISTEFYDILYYIKIFNEKNNCEIFLIDQAELLGEKKTAFIKKLFS